MPRAKSRRVNNITMVKMFFELHYYFSTYAPVDITAFQAQRISQQPRARRDACAPQSPDGYQAMLMASVTSRLKCRAGFTARGSCLI